MVCGPYTQKFHAEYDNCCAANAKELMLPGNLPALTGMYQLHKAPEVQVSDTTNVALCPTAGKHNNHQHTCSTFYPDTFCLNFSHQLTSFTSSVVFNADFSCASTTAI